MALKTIKKRLLTLLAAMMFSSMVTGTAFAVTGEPLPFDNFEVGDTGSLATAGKVNGEITAPCDNWVKPNGDPITVTCGPETISDGMLQRQVTVSSADPGYNGTYVQFIMVESGAKGDASAGLFDPAHGSLNFINEDFVKMNNRGEGLASKQTIVEAKFDNGTLQEQRFTNVTEFNMGWAQGVGVDDVWADIQQYTGVLQYDDVPASATLGGTYELSHELVSVQSDGTGVDNTAVHVDQMIKLDEAATSTIGTQKFKHTRLSGFYNNAGTDLFGGLINGNPLLPGGTNGGNVSWDAGNEIAATWIGLTKSDPEISLIFGFTQYENYTNVVNVDYGNAPNETKLVSFSSPEAGGSLGQWDLIIDQDSNPAFGHAEAMADVTPITVLTDYTVLTPVPEMGSSNLNYVANSDSTLPADTSGDFNPVDGDYNQWYVLNGVFYKNAALDPLDCPGDSCSTPIVNEDGLYQRVVTINGVNYYQTIMVDGAITGDPTEPDFIVDTNNLSPTYQQYIVNPLSIAASGTSFRNETFVKEGADTGIAARLHLAELGSQTFKDQDPTLHQLPSNGGDFNQDVTMNAGWANRGQVSGKPDALIEVDQGILVLDPSEIGAVSMQDLFKLERGLTQQDKRLTAYTVVGTREDGLALPAWGGFSEPIKFQTVSVSGAYQDTESLAGDPFTMVGDGTIAVPTGPQLLWAKGDALQATWMGASYATNAPVAAVVSSTSFRNNTDGNRAQYTYQYDPPDPDASWLVDPFGTVDSYTDPVAAYPLPLP